MSPILAGTSILSKGPIMAEAVRNRESRLRVSRRGFLKAGGVSAAVAAGAVGAVPFTSSRAFAQQSWDEEFDVVVVGSGAAGFTAGITAKSLGADTVILEKGAYVGGTTLVSGGGAFIANSRQMKEMGYEDPREERLKYMARYSWPHLYQPEHETLGLPQHDYDMISAYYDIGSVAIDHLEEVGAAKFAVQMVGGSVPPVPNVDYMDHFEEDIPKEAGTLATLDADGNVAGGANMIGVYKAWADANGMEVRLGHRVVRVVLSDAGAVIGVEVEIADAAAAATPSAATPRCCRPIPSCSACWR